MVEEQLATTTDSRGISASGRPASLSLGLTVAELQLGALRRRPDATALVYEGRRYSYRQMEERVSQVAQLFASKGLGRGDGVAVLAANRAEVIFEKASVWSNIHALHYRHREELVRWSDEYGPRSSLTRSVAKCARGFASGGSPQQMAGGVSLSPICALTATAGAGPPRACVPKDRNWWAA